MTSIASHAFDGLGAGGSRRPLPLRLTWLAVSALATQFLALWYLHDPAIRLVFPATIAALIPFLYANRRLLGVRILTAGILLNLLAIVANGGLMPVDAAAVDAVGAVDSASLGEGKQITGSKNVLLDPDGTRLRILTDTLLLPLPQPLTRAVSPGDLILTLGLCVAAVELSRALAWPVSPTLRTMRTAAPF